MNLRIHTALSASVIILEETSINVVSDNLYIITLLTMLLHDFSSSLILLIKLYFFLSGGAKRKLSDVQPKNTYNRSSPLLFFHFLLHLLSGK